MTRINVVPVEELCDQHLLAEHRELTRIPNAIAKGRYSLDGQPSEYTLGKGHVKFFYDKLRFLLDRYYNLNNECRKRGFTVEQRWPIRTWPVHLFKDYEPTEEALRINRERIKDRMNNFKPRWTKNDTTI